MITWSKRTNRYGERQSFRINRRGQGLGGRAFEQPGIFLIGMREIEPQYRKGSRFSKDNNLEGGTTGRRPNNYDFSRTGTIVHRMRNAVSHNHQEANIHKTGKGEQWDRTETKPVPKAINDGDRDGMPACLCLKNSHGIGCKLIHGEQFTAADRAIGHVIFKAVPFRNGKFAQEIAFRKMPGDD